MYKQAYFFQSDTLLIPAALPEAQINKALADLAIPLDLASDFNTPDIFEIPALNEPNSVINAVSVSPETVLSENWKSFPVRSLLNIFSVKGGDNARVSSLLRACHIAQWRRDSRFCGTCGAKNNDVSGQVCRLCPK